MILNLRASSRMMSLTLCQMVHTPSVVCLQVFFYVKSQEIFSPKLTGNRKPWRTNLSSPDRSLHLHLELSSFRPLPYLLPLKRGKWIFISKLYLTVYLISLPFPPWIRVHVRHQIVEYWFCDIFQRSKRRGPWWRSKGRMQRSKRATSACILCL